MIINGHPAAVVSEVGEHTPGVNSDAYFINEEDQKIPSALRRHSYAASATGEIGEIVFSVPPCHRPFEMIDNG